MRHSSWSNHFMLRSSDKMIMNTNKWQQPPAALSSPLLFHDVVVLLKLTYFSLVMKSNTVVLNVAHMVHLQSCWFFFRSRGIKGLDLYLAKLESQAKWKSLTQPVTFLTGAMKMLTSGTKWNYRDQKRCGKKDVYYCNHPQRRAVDDRQHIKRVHIVILWDFYCSC